MTLTKRFARTATAVAALTAAAQAQAVTFVLTDTGGAGVGTQARQGFEIAARYWSSVLTDAATINLNIGFQSLGTGILGQTGSASSIVSINQTYNAMVADATSALDTQAVASVGAIRNATGGLNTATGITGSVGAVVNGFANGSNGAAGYTDLTTRFDNDGSVNNDALAITKASAKALGLTRNVNNQVINYATADGSITFSNNFSFDFDPTDGIAAGSFDFIGVAIHEIGHALGFVSGVDTYDYFTAPGSTDPIVRDANGNPVATGLEGYVVMSQLDLFRYGAQGQLDWSTQGTPYFSINGGTGQLFGDSRFSLGTLNGDGYQASHWKDSASGVPQRGVMDPTSGYGQMQEITALDLAAFDAIGWNIGFNVLGSPTYRYTTADAYRAFATAGVPEPMTWAMMVLGFGTMGAALRRRKPSTTVRIRFA